MHNDNDNVPPRPKAPWWFWLVAVLYLLWNIIGCSMYLAEHMMGQESYIAAFGADLWALKEITPWWATAGYAVGVWGGLIGIILLLLRKKLCLPFFYASFVGAVIGFLPSILDGRFRAVMGGGDYGMMIFIWAECLLIIWLARKFTAKGILR